MDGLRKIDWGGEEKSYADEFVATKDRVEREENPEDQLRRDIRAVIRSSLDANRLGR